MTSSARPAPARPAPSDQAQRERALDPARSLIVQAPAGSGKTDLLTRRFLRLLAEVNDPGEVVAITFTKAAAAEMRHRILAELEKASSPHPSPATHDEFAMDTLAARALAHSNRLRWNLLELPSQLRISTIDSFCREIAIERPLLTSLGGGVDIAEQPDELYRNAARSTLKQLGAAQRSSQLQQAIEALLLWRDNNWQELENQLITMLRQRDRWMQEFWLRDFRDDESSWNALRELLERPFARAVAEHLSHTSRLLLSIPGACDEAHDLARFGCAQHGSLYRELAEMADFPHAPFASPSDLEAARQAYTCLAHLLLTNDGDFRKAVDTRRGFPSDYKREKQRHQELVKNLRGVEGFAQALAGVRDLPPVQYSEEDWRIVRACFILLRHAAAQLQVAFAEAGTVDFSEIAQIALRILEGEDRLPSEAALRIADGIHHLLVDEFQDTSRRQHKLLAALVAAWPDTVNRSLFVVGDPMQSIYFFRDADAELFPRVQQAGLELPAREALSLESIQLESNFRTRPDLVRRINTTFEAVFSVNDGSSVRFTPSQPARPPGQNPGSGFSLHVEFVPQAVRAHPGNPDSASLKEQSAAECDAALEAQIVEIVDLIRSRMGAMQEARARGEKYRIAVLGRARTALAPIAHALRDAAIPFRAVELEQLGDRPEVLDALALAGALQNVEDRVAWLGTLRAPWCALSLADLHLLTSADDPAIQSRPILTLMRERGPLLSASGRLAIDRLLNAYDEAASFRAAMPGIAPGTWLQQVWLRLGGASCVDAAAYANIELLWRSLDHLPAGDCDLASPALAAALNKLTALPDPDAESDCGVHLMTIHKSKGLEFEVVIVPELQARSGSTRTSMFGWLERGVETPDESGEITEFLIAPLQTRGGDRGPSKGWVDCQYRTKEAQETRRILYVAATRAREELHLFARLSYKLSDEEPALCDPAESLLLKAWPALEDELRDLFNQWKAAPQPAEALSLAAAADNVIPIRPAGKPAILHRLPSDFAPPRKIDSLAAEAATGQPATAPYQRHEGGLLSRARGTAIHLALEHLANLRSSHDWDTARAKLENIHERISARVRATGIDPQSARDIATEAVDAARRVSFDPPGAWILSPHADAAAEASWTGILNGDLRTVQADRVFRAGAGPLQPGSHVWWIVDYKTHAGDAGSVAELREFFAPQLNVYASVLRKLHGSDIAIRAGLYYPRMLQFDWWEA
ncbi:MAG TPA: UvrD-helicase domain-containing protein [Terracidiphilus sp.]